MVEEPVFTKQPQFPLAAEKLHILQPSPGLGSLAARLAFAAFFDHQPAAAIRGGMGAIFGKK